MIPSARHEATPEQATTRATDPRSMPGMRAKRETASASRSAEKARPARRSVLTLVAGSDRCGATEMATKSSPTNAPATPALAAKKAEYAGGTTALDGTARLLVGAG